MKRLLPFLTIVVLAAIAAVVIVLTREPSTEAAPTRTGVQTQSTGTVPTTAASTPPTAASTPTMAASTPPRVEPEQTATAGREFGSVNATMRQTQGSDHVACGNIQSEFAVYLDSGGGKVRWTGQVFDVSPRQYPFERRELQGITLDPATGLIELGQRQIVRVRGAIAGRPGSQFYVVVSAPNRVGTGWVSVEFTCR